MRRTLIALPLLLLAACGDDAAPAATSTPPDATATLPSIAPSESGYAYATGPDDVVISVGYEGGFVTPEVIFVQSPVALVTGDGRLLSTGPTTMIYPGQLLPNILERSITPEGIQTLLALADELGLLADVEYPRNDQIADAPDTVVTITVDGTTYRHQAYALGLEAEPDPARRALAEFVTAATNLPATVGEDQLGAEAPYEPANFLIQATPIDLTTVTFDVEPTVVTWPADASIRLADAANCAEMPAAEGRALFADATQLTFFEDGGVTYQVAVVQQVPGRTC